MNSFFAADAFELDVEPPTADFSFFCLFEKDAAGYDRDISAELKDIYKEVLRFLNIGLIYA